MTVDLACTFLVCMEQHPGDVREHPTNPCLHALACCCQRVAPYAHACLAVHGQFPRVLQCLEWIY